MVATVGNGSRNGGDPLEGVVERILFSNSETQYCVAALKPERGAEVTICGVLPNVQCGETVCAWGDWKEHPQYGRQFLVQRFEVRLPASVYGIRKYLGSGLLPGVGKRYAERIVARFGMDTIRILSEDSGRLKEVPGLGPKRIAGIRAAWDEQRALREVMLFLQTYGVGLRQCMRIVRAYGSSAIRLLREDPYLLAREIDGIGFKTADRIALNIGLANDSATRLDAGLLHIMHTLEVQGHTAAEPRLLVEHGAEVLQVSAERCEERLRELEARRDLITTVGLLQLPVTAASENKIAERIRTFLAAPSALPPVKVEPAIAWAEKRAGFDFAPEQADAVRAALSNKVTVLTGGPGTGKTAILRAVVDILRAKKAKLLLASPTGRAAQRLSEATGMQAATVHRLLRFDPALNSFLSDESSPLSCDILVLDEASMLDARLAAALLRAIPAKAHVLLVGDSNQLPSVGAGNVLADIIDSGKVTVVRLRRIFRQSGGSSIVGLAHQILEGIHHLPAPPQAISDSLPASDVAFIHAITPEACRDAVVALCTQLLPAAGFDARSQAQVLAPMHRGTAGIQALNSALQQAMNPTGAEFRAADVPYKVGDKVIQTRNDYDKNLFNGDMGIITAVDAEGATLSARFDDKDVTFSRMELADLQLAYAISIHKSQGSEFPVVIIPLLKQHYMLLQRNLVYTAVTRGKRGVIIVGDPDAWRMAVDRSDAGRRLTTLKERLSG